MKGLEMFRKLLERAEAGQMVGVLVEIDHKLVRKEALLRSDCEFPDDGEDQQNEGEEKV